MAVPKPRLLLKSELGGMVTHENAERWQQREHPSLQEEREQGGDSPAPVTECGLSRQPEKESGSTRGVAGSDGLIVAHVPDLGSLGLLMQQCETSQVFQEGM